MKLESKEVTFIHNWKCPICGCNCLKKVMSVDAFRGPVYIEEDLFYECENCSIVFRDYKKFDEKVLKKEAKKIKKIPIEKNKKEVLIECRCMHCGRKEKRSLKKDSSIYLYQKYRDEKRKIYYCIDTCIRCLSF